MTTGRSVSVALGVARRSTRKLMKNPILGSPPLLIPLFLFAAFAGALAAIQNTKGFGYYSYTAFVFVYVFYLGAMFVGAFSAFEIAADYEGGIGNRLMLAAPRRLAIIGGYLLYAVGRFVVGSAVIWAVALATGLSVRGGALEIAGLVTLALLLCIATALYGAGVALRLRSIAAATVILIPVFMILFLSPVFVPRDQLTGWLKVATGLNPLTPPVEAGRGFLADDPTSVALAFAVAVGLVIAFGAWAVRGMKKAENGPN